MPIRVQPAEIEITDDPNKDHFCHDNLKRKDSIEALTTLVGNIEGPCVMAVDASWGMGKTTFLRLWAEHLRRKKFPVVAFNAWESDYTNQPFVALTSEITDGLQSLLNDPDNPRIKRIVESSGRVLSNMSAPAVRLAASALPVVGGQLVEELDRSPSELAETMAAGYRSMKTEMSEFRVHLQDAATEAAAAASNRPLVVLIDELDRCRPTYAIELLESAKHFFNVDHVVFVICLDREQLAHSVRAIYGSGFSAEGYLRRFFDHDLRLPDPDRSVFIESMLDALNVSDHLKGSQLVRHLEPFDAERLPAILDRDNLSLRDLQQMIHRLGIMLSTASRSRAVHADMLALLLVLRTVSPCLYASTVLGNAKDSEVIEALSQSELSQESYGASIEALASGCVGHCTYLANGALDLEKLPHALKRLADRNDKYANLYLRQDISNGGSQQQFDQPRGPEHLGQIIRQQREEMESGEFLSRFTTDLNDFYSMRSTERWEILDVRNTRVTQHCIELLELFPEPVIA